MRHLRSILYALVLAPAVWILCGVGFTRDLTGRAQDAGSVETASAILLLVLAGAAYAILIFSPISPLGPALFGLLFLMISLWAVIAPDSYAGVWPAAITKAGFDLSRPGYALAALLAIPMLCTALSVRRWRGYEPPQLPLIGTLGRAHGAAAAPGMPVAAERTAVISSADPTEAIALSDPAPPPPGQVAPTPVATWPVPAQHPAEPPTEAVPTEAMPTQSGPVANADEPTAMVVPASSDEPTTAMNGDRPGDEPTITAAPARDEPGDEPTVLVAQAPASDQSGAEHSGEEPTVLVALPTALASASASDESGDEPPAMGVAASGDEPAAPDQAEDDTVSLERSSETPASSDEPTDTSADEPTGPMPASAENGEPVEAAPAVEAATAVEEPAGIDPDEIKDEVLREDAAAEGTEETAGPLPDETVAKVAGAEPVVGGDGETPTADEVGPPATPYDSRPPVDTDADTEPVGSRPEPTAAPDEPTEATTHEVAAIGDEPTDAHTGQSDEPTEAHTHHTATAASDEPHTHGVQTIAAGDERTSASDDEPTDAGTGEGETVTADLGGADEEAEPDDAQGFADDEDERTQVIRLPAARTDSDPDGPTHPLERGDRTQGVGPGETTQVIFWREPANQITPEEAARAQAAAEQAARDRAAQERARQAFRDRAAQERAKEAFAERAARDAREHGEQTQFIDLAALRAQAIPGDQTQVLPGAGRTVPSGDRARTAPHAGMAELAGDQTQVLPDAGESTQVLPSAGTVERPGDRTQVLSFPPAARPVVPRQAGPRRDAGERTTDRQEPETRAKSIIGEEQPDPAADPTTRLSLLRPPGEHAGEGTTDGNNRRTKSMLDLERPADESADDTRRLVAPPRKPQEDEPTTRL